MTSTAEVAAFAADVSYDGLPETTCEAAKRRVLDAVGVALGSRDDERTAPVRRAVPRVTTDGCRLWGTTDASTASDAANHNATATAVGPGGVYLSPTLSAAYGPLAAVLAVAESRGVTGEETLAALAATQEIHGELALNAPLDEFHPASHGAIAGAAGVGRVLGLDAERIERAVGLAAGQALLAVGDDEYAALAVGASAATAAEAGLLAEAGAKSPDTLAGPGGWHDLVGPFDLDFDPGCERVRDAAVLPYDVHPYAQTAIAAAVDLASDAALDPADVDTVTVETFADAVPVVEPEAIAAALVDRELYRQPTARADLGPVAEAVETAADDGLTDRAAHGELPARVTVKLRDGAVHEVEHGRFDGHPAQPAPWGTVEEKFHALAGDRYDADRRADIVDTVRSLEAESATELALLLD